MSNQTENSSHFQLTRSMVLLMAFAVGAIVANLYYTQPIIGSIATSLGLSLKVAGLVTMLTQMGYGTGVLFLVPLADLVENRKLILTLLVFAMLSLIAVAFSTHLVPYFIAAFLLGLCSSAVQIIVPYVAHFASDENRGHIVGQLMSGLMIGIMFSRPISSFLTEWINWHAVFVLSAIVLLGLFFVLLKFLPARKPQTQLNYFNLMKSMGHIVLEFSVLRRRSVYQAFMFSAFCLFWTTTPVLLLSSTYGFSHTGVALFALAGIAGAVAAPIAGKYADRGKVKLATTLAMLLGMFSFLLTRVFEPGSTAAVIALVLAAILLDAGVTANLVLGQRSIFSLSAEHRGRMNGIYVAIIFVGGAFGSFIGTWAYSSGGWSLASQIGAILPFVGFVFFLTERRAVKTAA